MKLPFCAYLLLDEWTLIAYEHGEHVTVADIQRRLYMLGKAKDVFKPDYCFEGIFKEEMREMEIDDRCCFLPDSAIYILCRHLLPRYAVPKHLIHLWISHDCSYHGN